MQKRIPNSNRAGGSFPSHIVQLVWNKAKIAPGYDPNRVRKDACGALIVRERYGMTSDYGWEVDHVVPVAAGGGDELSNLQPLQWENNRSKGDTLIGWRCKITA